jgi:hypothetical protein
MDVKDMNFWILLFISKEKGWGYWVGAQLQLISNLFKRKGNMNTNNINAANISRKLCKKN